MLFLATGRINGKRVKMFFAVLFITIILAPFITVYRTMRAESISESIESLLANAAKNALIDESEPFIESLKSGSSYMLVRFTGADSLLHVLGSNNPPLYWTAFIGPTSVTRHYTVNIVGFPEEAIHSEAPSAVGWFYMVGGTSMVVFGTLFSLVLVWFYWCSLAKLKLRCLPVAQALSITWFIIMFIEGTLDTQFIPLLVIVGSIIVCDLVLRINRKTFVLSQ